MEINKNGIIISNATACEQSNLGDGFFCMWDKEGMPIHISKRVIDYLYASIHPQPQPKLQPNNDLNDVFLDKME